MPSGPRYANVPGGPSGVWPPAGWSESKLSRIEAAHIGSRRPDPECVLGVYSVYGPARVRLLVVAGRSR
jgi:hypothetical protein